jgi:hypothetical protein
MVFKNRYQKTACLALSFSSKPVINRDMCQNLRDLYSNHQNNPHRTDDCALAEPSYKKPPFGCSSHSFMHLHTSMKIVKDLAYLGLMCSPKT